MGENGTQSTSTTNGGGGDVHPPDPAVFIAMPLLPQAGEVFVGPGARKEAQVLGLGLTKLSSRRREDLASAKRYAMDVSIKQIMIRQQKAQQENQQKQIMYAQALSLMARVYIGSVSFEVREDNIKKAFEVFGPIKSINMSYDASTGHHKGFAFLEYEVPEAALLAQESMNGQLMGGRNLKVGRPSNMPQAQPIIEMLQNDAKKYYRVYVSSVHPDLSESDLKSVFEAFGEIVKCQLARQSSIGKGSHRGFGYIEFNNGRAMMEAITGMNMFDLGGQFLRVGRCITPPEALQYLQPTAPAAIPAAAAVAAAAITAKVMAAEATGPKPGSGAASPRNQSPAPRGISPAPSSPSLGSATPPGFTVPPPPTLQAPSRLALPSTTPAAVPEPAVVVPPPPPQQFIPPQQQFLPPPPQFMPAPPPPSVVEPSAPRRGFGGFAAEAPPPPAALPPPGLLPEPSGIPEPGVVVPPVGVVESSASEVATAAPAAPSKPKKKNKKKGDGKSLDEKMKTLFTQQKALWEESLMGPASYGEADPMVAPKDGEEEKQKQEQLSQLAITGSVQSMALAIIGDGAIVAKGKLKVHDQEKKEEAPKKRYSNRVKDPKKIQPKLNTATKVAAANAAGELGDAIRQEASAQEDASLASQESVQSIRGNDARHLLMAKLMRTNRSCVLILRNMVGPEDIDEFLEEEIREECSKFGKVIEVIIANDPGAGVVKIFVRYAEPQEVDEAIKTLNGRFFAGRTVKAEVYDQALFDHNDLSG